MSHIGIVNSLKSALHLLHRNWFQMMLYALIIWVLNVILLAPPTSWILKKLGSNGDVIVGNYGISNWLLTPHGVAYIVLAGAVIPFSIILYIVGLFWIANASIDETALTTRESLTRVAVQVPRLLRFSLYVFTACLALVLLLGVGLGAVYLLLLNNHDINYYKTVHPPQWYWALALGGMWAIGWLITVVYITLRSMFVLPLWLEGGRTAREALRVSWDKTNRKLKSLVGVFASFIAVWLLAVIVFQSGIFTIAGFMLKNVISSLNGILFVVSVHLLVSTVLEAILDFIGLGWCVCIWIVCYRQIVHSIPLNNRRLEASEKQVKLRTRLFEILRPRIILPVIAGLLVISGGLSLWMFWNTPNTRTKPRVIAHRAGAAVAPENTLAALEKAIEDGAADYVEIDVQLTRDGVIVVAHDKDLMKVANDPRNIRETIYADFSEVDIGRQFAPKFKGQRLSTLSDFLESGKGRTKFIIEFKQSAGTDLVEKTIDAVNQYDMKDDVALASLDLNDVRRTQELTSDIAIGYFVLTELGDLTQLDVDFIGVHQKHLTPKLLRTFQGMDVYGWTVDDPKRVLELVEMGIDGIITNKTAQAARIAERYQELNSIQRALVSYRRFWDVFLEMGLWDPQPSTSPGEMSS